MRRRPNRSLFVGLCLCLLIPLHAAQAAPTAPLLAASSATHVDTSARMARHQLAADPALAAMQQMRWMERIYRAQKEHQKAEQMYRDVLGRTQNTALRNFANRRLVKLAAWQPRDLAAALIELQRGLDENLAKLP